MGIDRAVDPLYWQKEGRIRNLPSVPILATGALRTGGRDGTTPLGSPSARPSLAFQFADNVIPVRLAGREFDGNPAFPHPGGLSPFLEPRPVAEMSMLIILP
jgi:hypothetical protein